MKHYFLCFSILILFASCNKNTSLNPDGTIQQLPILWSINTGDNGTWCDGYDIHEPVINGDNVLINGVQNQKQVFRMINSQNGNEAWVWNDFFYPKLYANSSYTLKFPWLKDNKMIWQTNFETYNIDLTTGKTVWKNDTHNDLGEGCNGIANLFFTSMYSLNEVTLPNGSDIFVGDTQTGKIQFLAHPKYDTTDRKLNTNRYGVILGTAPFISGQDTMLLVSFADQPITNYFFRCAFGTYNLSKNQWQIERSAIGNPTNTGTTFTPIIQDGKVFHCREGHVTCHDIFTGEQKWDYNVGAADFLFSGILVANGKVFANGSNRVLHCIDIKTGLEIWNEISSSSSSDMGYLNGIVYFVGGDDGLLHAVDESTGKTIWKVISPDTKLDHGDFTRFCAVVPGKNGAKGRIVTHTGYHAVCYEAAK